MEHDREVFDRFPELREMVGNYGDPVRKIRPTQREFQVWLSRGTGGVLIQGWVIADCHGWKRDLFEIDPVQIRLGREDGPRRHITFAPRHFPRTVTAHGLVVWAYRLGFVVNSFRETPVVRAVENITLTYNLVDDGVRESYLPTDDFYC